MKSQVDLKKAIGDIAANGPKALARLANWILDNYSEIAFQSVRGLADAANVNSNTVIRLAKTMGYTGYDDLRQDVQNTLRRQEHLSYGDRAGALRKRPSKDIFSDFLDSYQQNAAQLFQAATLDGIQNSSDTLGSANNVYCVGVRSCYSVAHYMSYVGSMAFPTFKRAPSEPGAIMDQLAHATDQDVLVAISFSYYSVEVIRACEIANNKGMKIIAITDRFSSPLAKGATHVIELPMSGPQYMPSLHSAFIVVDLLLTHLATKSPFASENIRFFENQVLKFGGYVDN
ncbi:MAG: MurR/RpiR family transcriptional regulator [Flavobacteriaceae bacterium]|nr:MurR/RpiR family transcriptional regulator [Flavobacteriaceae bacterium]